MDAIAGKNVLITGAARHIGREIALAFSARGANVAFTFLSSDRDARSLERKLLRNAGAMMALRCDIRQQSSVQQTVADVTRGFGGLDILINNAGRYGTIDFEKITVTQWDDMFATNARGAFLMSQTAAKALRRSRGRIINIGSIGGMRPWATHAHYCASKAALHMLTLASAKALAPQVAVNAIAPGMIVLADSDSSSAARFARKTPARRNGTAADIVSAVFYLATVTPFMTGQVLAVDGGLSLT